jgi:hypothetical protein
MSDAATELVSSIICDHLRETYGLEPYILPNGRTGIHFLEMSNSLDFTDRSLREQIEFDISNSRHKDGTLGVEYRADLERWQATLMAALDVVRAALAEIPT